MTGVFCYKLRVFEIIAVKSRSEFDLYLFCCAVPKLAESLLNAWVLNWHVLVSNLRQTAPQWVILAFRHSLFVEMVFKHFLGPVAAVLGVVCSNSAHSCLQKFRRVLRMHKSKLFRSLVKPILPLDSLWIQELVWLRGNLVSIVAFIRVGEVILKHVLSKILNFFFVNGELLLLHCNFRLVKVCFVIRGLRASGNQNRLTARLSCLKAKFRICSSWLDLWITLLKHKCMLLNQRRTYERSGSLLRGSLLAEESLRVGIILNWLWCVHLTNSEGFFANYCTLRRNRRSVKPEFSIQWSVFLVALRTSWSMIIWACICHLLCNISSNSTLR